LDKAPDAFRTISEVAEDLDVPQHVLRFWESRFSQIRPMKRGGGRRYYRPDDVALLRGIRQLLYGQGYTIRGVQRILREQGIRFVQTVWEEGAEQPERSPADDMAAGEVEPAEPSALDMPPLPVTADERREPTFAMPPGHAPRPLSADDAASQLEEAARARPQADPVAGVDRGALQAALDELAECRRLLEAALQEPG
jgi:DNA-binding transcriptional MerR regulator